MATSDSESPASQTTTFRYLPLVLLGLLALTAVLRCPGLGRPLLGPMATKNVVYAMIARNFANGDGNLFCPTLDVLRGGAKSLHMVDFPLAAYLTGGMWGLIGGSLDVWGRCVSLVFSVGSVWLMFLLVRRQHGEQAAVGSAFTLAVAPVSIIYGQSFMLEASLVFLTLATFYSLDRGLGGNRNGWLVVSAICFGMLLLTKIYMLVLLLPLAAEWIRCCRNANGGHDQSNDEPTRERPSPWLACALLAAAVVPAAVWYGFAYLAAAPGSPYQQIIYYSIRQSSEAHSIPSPLLLSADFHRQLLDDISRMVMTPPGLLLLLAGLLNRGWLRYIPWLFAMLILVLVLPRKFYELNYYWMVVLPPLCILAGLGWDMICRRMQPGRLATTVLALLILVFSLRHAVGPAFVTPAEDRAVIVAAEKIREWVPPGRPIVTMHGTGIDLLYYCDRPGWVVTPDGDLEEVLPDYMRGGAGYLVVVGDGPRLPEVPKSQGNGFRIHRLSLESLSPHEKDDHHGHEH